MSGLTYGEMRALWLGAMAVIAAIGAAIAGEGLLVVMSLLGFAGVIFFVAWRRFKQ
jgi:hypothetical protein